MTAVLRNVVKRGDKLVEVATFSEPTKTSSRAVLTGMIELVPGQGRVKVNAFVNERKGEENEGKTFISLSTEAIDEGSGEVTYRQVAIGNVINSRGDGGEVYFDTVVFNPVDPAGRNARDAQPVSAYVTEACSEELHRRLGFTSSRIPRPRRDATAPDAGGEDGQPAGSFDD